MKYTTIKNYCVYDMLNKNSLAARPIRSHKCKQPKTLISSKVKKLNILLRILLLEWHAIVYRAFSQLWLALSLGHKVTKPIIVVKMPCKLLHVIQVKGFLIKCSTSWPYLISEFLVAYICGFWLASHFFTARLFLFSISLLFVSIQKQNILL